MRQRGRQERKRRRGREKKGIQREVKRSRGKGERIRVCLTERGSEKKTRRMRQTGR
jgi:hypothetical protein